MPVVTSADGTAIAYEHTGTGPALILVDGAMCYRAAGPLRPLAAQLQDAFTVYTYDRRGRGDSGDTTPFAVEREVEDLQALIAAAGGTAYVYGLSSGGALAIAAAAAGSGITALALYETPFLAEVEDGVHAKQYSEQLTELLSAGRHGDAVALFMARVGMPAEAVAEFRASPGWALLEAIAPTLAYDDAVLNGARVPRELAAKIAVPTVVISGSASPQLLRGAARATADALPGATSLALDDQTHDVDPAVLAPALTEFFQAAGR